MRPEYALQILAGEKRVEFRRTAFARDVSHFVVYATKPIGHPIAVCKVSEVRCGVPTSVWRSFQSVGGISEKKFRAYYRGSDRAVAIGIESVRRLAEGMSLRDLGILGAPPQSFVYLDADSRATVLEAVGYRSRARAVRRPPERSFR